MTSLDRVPVLVAAGGAAWEVSALEALSRSGSGLVVQRRCVDLTDLLAAAATGQGAVALLDSRLDGLDADAVARLAQDGLAAVVVTSAGEARAGEEAERLTRLGVRHLVGADDISALPERLRRAATGAARDAAEPPLDLERLGADGVAGAPSEASGRVVAVWGPTGAPGRTTVAVGLAAELAAAGRRVLLVDADGYGGAVGQHLGVLDEVSGLLAAARLGNTGRLDEASLAEAGRQVAPRFTVLTGLPRPDRWVEVREPAFRSLLEVACRTADDVVLDLGFCLEQDPDAAYAGAPHRNLMTLVGLEVADEVVVVGSADPVGLSRLARGLVELLDAVPASGLRVVVNRTRPGLGWDERQLRTMVEGFVTPVGVHFLPDDRGAADRALARGRSLTEAGDSALRRALAGVARALAGGHEDPRPARAPRLRRRRAATAR